MLLQPDGLLEARTAAARPRAPPSRRSAGGHGSPGTIQRGKAERALRPAQAQSTNRMQSAPDQRDPCVKASDGGAGLRLYVALEACRPHLDLLGVQTQQDLANDVPVVLRLHQLPRVGDRVRWRCGESACSETTASAMASGVSRRSGCPSPWVTASPSAPSVVETTGVPAAMASRTFSRVPPPTRRRHNRDQRAVIVRAHVVDGSGNYHTVRRQRADLLRRLRADDDQAQLRTRGHGSAARWSGRNTGLRRCWRGNPCGP